MKDSGTVFERLFIASWLFLTAWLIYEGKFAVGMFFLAPIVAFILLGMLAVGLGIVFCFWGGFCWLVNRGLVLLRCPVAIRAATISILIAIFILSEISGIRTIEVRDISKESRTPMDIKRDRGELMFKVCFAWTWGFLELYHNVSSKLLKADSEETQDENPTHALLD